MATGRFQAGFFHTRTCPTGPDLIPKLGLFNKRVFFYFLFMQGSDPPRGPRLAQPDLAPIYNAKKKTKKN